MLLKQGVAGKSRGKKKNNRGCEPVSLDNDGMSSYNLKKNDWRVVMTKAELADRLYEKVGLPKKEATTIVETLFDSMKSILAEGESIKITGFGTFLVRKKNSRKGRNPKTGTELEIEQRRVVTFKPSLQFKALVEKV